MTRCRSRMRFNRPRFTTSPSIDDVWQLVFFIIQMPYTRAGRRSTAPRIRHTCSTCRKRCWKFRNVPGQWRLRIRPTWDLIEAGTVIRGASFMNSKYNRKLVSPVTSPGQEVRVIARAFDSWAQRQRNRWFRLSPDETSTLQYQRKDR